MRSDDPQPVIDWLRDRPSTVRSLLARAAWLETVQAALRAWLAEPWSSHVRVANLRGDRLVVFCDTAAAWTRLRLQQHAVLAFVNERFGLSCTRLEGRVQPIVN